MFASWGRFVHRRRGPVLAFSLLMLAAMVALLVRGGDLEEMAMPEGTESAEAMAILNAELGGNSESRFILLFGSDQLDARGEAFRSAMDAALAPLAADPRVKSIVTPWAGSNHSHMGELLVGKDGRHAMAIVTVEGVEEALEAYPELRALVSSPTLTVTATDGLATMQDFHETLAADLMRAEIGSLPVVLLLLVVVFGAVVAAVLPLAVGLLAVTAGIGAVLALSHATDVSTYAMNVVTLIGLGVAIDYSLFIVNRFQEELARGATPREALATTMATAGRATVFSGLIVAIGLAGLAFYEGLYFASMGLAGAIVVAFAVSFSLTFLPALLAFLGPRVNKWKVRNVAAVGSGSAWRRMARAVMNRPAAFLVPALLLVLVAGAPFLSLRMASGDVTQLPDSIEARRGHDVLRDQFPAHGITNFAVVIQFPSGYPITADRVGALYDFSRAMVALPGVAGVQSIVDLDPSLSKEDYQRIYTSDHAEMGDAVHDVLHRTVGRSIVLLLVSSTHPANSDEARELVDTLRAMPAVADGEALVTGGTAFDMDAQSIVAARTPYAVAFVVGATLVLLFLQTGSIVLPLKAVVMNFISIAASFGALVLVFQWGYLSDLLGFTPNPLDPAVPVLLFCIVFGLSMDYEVLLLSRMHESYLRTKDNRAAVEEGLAQSGRLVTGAAAIMVVVFAAFGLADVVLIKALGIGLALAVALDATLVRGIIVPASMRLMGDLNWWAPPPLARLARRFGEHGQEAAEVAPEQPVLGKA